MSRAARSDVDTGVLLPVVDPRDDDDIGFDCPLPGKEPSRYRQRMNFSRTTTRLLGTAHWAARDDGTGTQNASTTSAALNDIVNPPTGPLNLDDVPTSHWDFVAIEAVKATV